MNQRIVKGQEGEQLVADYLKKEGYTILSRNYKKMFGEVDLIAQKNDTLVFVEVKWRKNPLIDPAEIITLAKQKKITLTARYFLAESRIKNVICRFDVALIEAHNTPNLRYIPNAFEAIE